jgi:hypothetical protein
MLEINSGKRSKNMKKILKKKSIIIVLVILILILIAGFLLINKNILNNEGKNQSDITTQENTDNENQNEEEFVQVEEDGTKLNVSTKLNETKVVNGLEFSNINLSSKDGRTILLADVKNNSGKATETKLVSITLLDKNGETILEVGGMIKSLEEGEQTKFETSITLDYANVYDFKIEVKE